MSTPADIRARLAHTLDVAEEGVVQVGKLRHLVVSPGLISEIQKGVEDRLGSKASEYLYAAGANWAAELCRRFRKAMGHDAPEELARLLCEHATEMGWGQWRCEALSGDERGLMVRVRRSPLASAYGSSDAPVCHILAGAVGALCEAVFHVPAACNEESCAAQGAPDCLFVATGTDLAAADSWAW
ncbi:MAG: hypothetical protein JXR96_21060 [Deltaproteobacteria bacterium]|nr:hypothetical protein [Deltaproteobacteria bacterium]